MATKKSKLFAGFTKSLGKAGTVIVEYLPEIALTGLVLFALYEGAEYIKKSNPLGPTPDPKGAGNKSEAGGPKESTTTQAPASTQGMTPVDSTKLTTAASDYADTAEQIYKLLNSSTGYSGDELYQLMSYYNTDELKQLYIDFGQRAPTVNIPGLRNFALGDKHDLIYWMQNDVAPTDLDRFQDLWKGTGLWGPAIPDDLLPFEKYPTDNNAPVIGPTGPTNSF